MVDTGTANEDFVAEEIIAALEFRPETRRQQKRSVESKMQIVEASLQAFMDLGYDGVSTHHVAEQAQVTQGLITYHFKSKEGLWQAAMDRFFGDFRNELASRIRELNDIDDPLFYRLMVRHIIRWPSQYPFVVSFMTENGPTQRKRLSWLVDRHVRPIFKTVAHILDTGKAEGIIREFDTTHLYFFLMTSSSVFSRQEEVRLLARREVASKEFIDSHTDMLVNMVVRDEEQIARLKAARLKK
ncbi:TetR/AcrR family transcriptional regulator [Novosphingopyxis sp.]|uniref:TetR/AcrR family transcriptional regulator n=1 Tax=Novosphingopyxis sp. TaxID=2709690 RepID=UPI003B5C44C8